MILWEIYESDLKCLHLAAIIIIALMLKEHHGVQRGGVLDNVGISFLQVLLKICMACFSPFLFSPMV